MGSSSLLTIATQIMAMSLIVAAVILFVGIGFLVLLHICIVGKAFRAGLSTVAQGEVCRGDGRDGLSPHDLEKLPCYDFDGGGGGDRDCAVCLESLRSGEKCRLLPVCRHSFHARCVDCWLVRTPICPICRTRACSQEGGENNEPLTERGTAVFGFPAGCFLVKGAYMERAIRLVSIWLEKAKDNDDESTVKLKLFDPPYTGSPRKVSKKDGGQERKKR